MRTPAKGNYFLALVLVSGIVFANCIVIFLNFISYVGGFEYSFGIGSLMIISQLSSFAIPLFIYFAVTRDNFSQLVSFKGIKIIDAVLIIAMTICILPLASFISSITAIFFQNTVGESIIELYEFPFWVPVLLVCVMPAVFEELAMRGVILGNYGNVPIKKAAIMNGFFFGMMHLNFFQFLYAFVLGFIFAYFVYYTKSILASIIAHFTFNFVQTGLVYAAYQIAKSDPELMESLLAPATSSEMLWGILYSGIVALIFTPIFIMLFRNFIAHKKWEILNNDLEKAITNVEDVNLEEKAYNVQEEQEHNESRENEVKSKKVITAGFWLSIGIYVFVMGLNVIASILNL